MAASAVVDQAAPAPPAGVTEQISYSGTPRFGDGSTRPDDYVAELANPVTRMQRFEELRASDDAVNTALTAREQMLYSANWQLTAPDDSPRSTEITEFVEDNIYPVLEQLLRQVGGGAIQYGVGMVEPVFVRADQPSATQVAFGKVRRAARRAPGGSRRLYLAKLAHIRQRTVWTFDIAETGDLRQVRQYVFNGSSLARRDIPGAKVLRWTYNQQGDDYWGVPPTRSAYKAWTFKRQLESIVLLGADRFGAGTPVAIGGQDWGDAEYTTAQKYLAAWRAGANSGLTLPFGGSVDLKGGDAGLFSALLEILKWYTLAIAKTYLTHGTELGSTNTGARALGETMYEQAEGVVQADCEAVAQIINERLIVPMVLWNFGPQDAYPTFTPSQRVRASNAIGQLLTGWVQQGIVKWTAADEQWLRDANGMPDIDVQARQQEMDAEAQAKQAAADALKQRLAGSGNAGGAGDGQNPQDPQPGTGPSAQLARGRGSDRMVGGRGEGDRRAPRALAQSSTTAPYGEGSTVPLRTPQYSAWELAVVQPGRVARDLDLEQARTTGEVQDVLRQIDLALALLVVHFAAKGVAALANSLAAIAVTDAYRRQLEGVLYKAADRASAYGEATVTNEVARQSAPGIQGPGALPTLPRDQQPAGPRPTPDQLAEQRDRVLQAEVQRAAAEEISRRELAARAAARDAIAEAGASTPAELAATARARTETTLGGLSTARTADNVGGVVNTGFGNGRNAAAEALAAQGRIRSKVYSCVMDENSCEECMRWDGAEFPLDWPESPKGVSAPNPHCAGTIKRCRCIWVYVSDAESRPPAPASKGPAVFPVR